MRFKYIGNEEEAAKRLYDLVIAKGYTLENAYEEVRAIERRSSY